jgi:hypothetical protein
LDRFVAAGDTLAGSVDCGQSTIAADTAAAIVPVNKARYLGMGLPPAG